MALAFTLHQINSKTEKHAPHQVIDVSDDDYADLERLGAIRAPTEDELALHALTNAEVVEATVQPVTYDRAGLEARANAINVKFSPKLSDEKLLERIVEAEAAAVDNDPDVSEAAAVGNDPDVSEAAAVGNDPDVSEAAAVGNDPDVSENDNLLG